MVECDTLYFDKTRLMSGYPVRLFATKDFFTRFEGTDVNSLKKIHGVVGLMHQIIWSKLNATVEIVPTTIENLGTIDIDGNPDGTLKDILMGTADAMINARYLLDIWRNQVNTFRATHLCYVSRKHNFEITYSIFSLLPAHTWFAILLLCVGSTLVLSWVMKINLNNALMDVYRAILGVKMLYQPKSSLASIPYIFLLFILSYITAHLQSKLNSMRTVSPINFYDIRSSQEVANLQLEVYGRNVFIPHFSNTPLHNSLKYINNLRDCLQIIKQRSNAICVEDCLYTSRIVQEDNNLHISQDDDIKKYYVYIFRDDFPHIQYIQRIYFALIESRISDHLLYLDLAKTRLNITTKNSSETISLNQLKFVFLLLLINHLFAILIMIAECLFKIVKRKPKLLFIRRNKKWT